MTHLLKYWPPYTAIFLIITSLTTTIATTHGNRLVFCIAITILGLSIMWLMYMITRGLHAFADQGRTLNTLRKADPAAQQAINKRNLETHRVKIQGKKTHFQLGDFQQCLIIVNNGPNAYKDAMTIYNLLLKEEKVVGGTFKHENIINRRTLKRKISPPKKRRSKTKRTHLKK